MPKKKLTMADLLPESVGYHNKNLDATVQRLVRGNTYRNLSTVWLTPSTGWLRPKVVSNWMNLMRPMNQNVLGPVFLDGDEVGNAYEKGFRMVLDHPELSKFTYILTCEHDNLPPSDGLLKLYEDIGDYDCVAGLYFTKGEAGQPMIYGNVKEMPINFIPQIPQPDTVQQCRGLGMGFNLWKTASLKNKLKSLPRPWFKTVQEIGKGYTQDLWFYQEAAKFGFKVACSTRVKVGHLDTTTADGMVW